MERMSRDADKRRSLFACAVALLLSTWKLNEQRSETYVAVDMYATLFKILHSLDVI